MHVHTTTDDIAALRQQNTALKKFCQALKDEQDAALINYAVAEGVYTVYIVQYVLKYGHW